MEKILLAILVLATFLMRPSAFGQEYTSLAIVVTAVVICLFHLTKKSRFGSGEKTISGFAGSPNLWIILTLWVFLLFQGGIVGKSNIAFLLKAFCANLILVVCYAAILKDPNRNGQYFKTFCSFNALIGWSIGITLFLSVFVPIDSLFLFHLDIKGYVFDDIPVDQATTTGDIYFPFSMLYGVINSNSMSLFRFSGFYVEAGVAQAYFAWAYIYESFGRNSKLVKYGLIVGTIGTFSTIGLVVLAYSISMVFLLKIKVPSYVKLFFAVGFAGIALAILFYAPYIGIVEKFSAQEDSFSDRTGAVEATISALANNWLGEGLYSSNRHNSGINLIAALGQIGIIGFLLYILNFIWPIFLKNKSRRRMLWVLLNFPLLLTSLVSQPLIDAPSIYILLFAQAYAFLRSDRGAMGRPAPGNRITNSVSLPLRMLSS